MASISRWKPSPLGTGNLYCLFEGVKAALRDAVHWELSRLDHTFADTMQKQVREAHVQARIPPQQ